jgi:hypothetical protein
VKDNGDGTVTITATPQPEDLMPNNTYIIKFTIDGTDIGIPPVSEITINVVGPNC